MGVKDIIVTPAYLTLLILLAYWVRPFVTSPMTRKYFIPALLVRFAGAITLGLIYQFYYGGGDTFNYFTYGSRWIWEAFLEDPIAGFKMILESGGERQSETFRWSQHIWYYRDKHSYIIVRIAGLLGLLTLHTYSSTTLFFALFSFSGAWAMYTALTIRYSNVNNLHIVTLFVPSVIFWGSGILKDTVTLGALGWLTWAVINYVIFKRNQVSSLIVALIASVIILSIKSYILLCFVPVILVLVYLQYIQRIKNKGLKILLIPLLTVIVGGMGFLAVTYAATEEYNINNIAQRAAVTAYDIRYGWGARNAGDGGYDIGIPDGTWQSMVALAPKAIVVSLFRPFPWEVRNPLMLLAALESLAISVLTLRLLFNGGFRYVLKDPFLMFCLTFAMLFAFAVGVSTGNFGTLMRYKIPLMPFFLVVLLKLAEKYRG